MNDKAPLGAAPGLRPYARLTRTLDLLLPTMRHLFTIAVFLAASSTLAAPTRSKVLSAGLCEQPKPEQSYAQPQSTAGYATIGDLVITKQTEVVPLRKGIGFGFTWQAEGLPRVAKVVYLIEHPPITKPDGKRIQSFEEPMEHETDNGALRTTDCYMLSEDHELVPGDWSLTILFEGTPLVKRTVHVVRQP